MHLIGSKGCFVDTDCNKLNQIKNKSTHGSMAPAFGIQAIYWKERNKELNKRKSKVRVTMKCSKKAQTRRGPPCDSGSEKEQEAAGKGSRKRGVALT